jgi:hypothetical protein
MEEEEGAHIKTTPFDLGSVYRKLRYFKRIWHRVFGELKSLEYSPVAKSGVSIL